MSYDVTIILKEIFDKYNNVRSFHFARFRNSRLIQEIVSNTIESNQIQRALEIRKELGFSFWESLMSTYLIENNETSDLFINEALFHNQFDAEFKFEAQNISKINEFLQSNNYKNVALLSKVTIEDNNALHIPMIDFHIPISKSNQKIVISIVSQLKLAGYVIESGNSYHFISPQLITQDELISFLGKLILFTPIIDRNWISHQIIEKCCALRVSKSDKISPRIVEVISEGNSRKYTQIS